MLYFSLNMKERRSNTIDVHVNLEGFGDISVPVNPEVLARKLRFHGFQPGQAEWERRAGVEHHPADKLAFWLAVKEEFTVISKLVEHLSHRYYISSNLKNASNALQ